MNLAGLAAPYEYGAAYPQWVAVTTPAAGATASYTVTGLSGIRPLAARLSLTTDANVASRVVTVDYIDAKGTTWLRNGTSALVLASTTAQTFEFDAHRTLSEWNTGTPVFAPLAPFFLPPGFSVKFNVTNIQATDAISGLALWFDTFQTDDFPSAGRPVIAAGSE
jgi:hypothetical protein